MKAIAFDFGWTLYQILPKPQEIQDRRSQKLSVSLISALHEIMLIVSERRNQK